MKIILSLFLASALFAPKTDALPEIDLLTQIDVLAHHFEIASAQMEAAPYMAAVKAAIAAAGPSDAKAAAQCNPGGGTKYQFELKDHKVVCALAPPDDTGGVKHLPAGGTVSPATPRPPAPTQSSYGANSPNVANVTGDVVIPPAAPPAVPKAK